MGSQRERQVPAQQSSSISPLVKPPLKPKPRIFQSLCSHASQPAENDPKIIGITAAMATGTGLDKPRPSCPNNIDVGIAEQHAVTLAAGLACERMRPQYTPHLTTRLRSDNSRRLHPKLASFLHGQSWNCRRHGPTHQGMYDIAYLRCLIWS